MFAGLAWGAGYVDSIPNFEFLSVILFAGGFVLGPAWGALAAALGEFLYSVINPYGSGLLIPLVLASQVLGMALVGAAGGWVGRMASARPPVRAAVVIAAGVLGTLVFDFLTNLASGIQFGQPVPTLVAGVPFAVVHVGTNAALFATVGVLLAGALERTRRSLLVAVCAVLFSVTEGATQPVPAPPWPPAIPDSGAVPITREDISIPDSTVQSPAPPARADTTWRRRMTAADSLIERTRRWATPPPWWGDGGAMLLRRSDDHAAIALTQEGGMTERFEDDAGSAEPLGRFGVPGGRPLLTWLGLPLTTLGAVGAEPSRIPWYAVGTVEAPDLPVSARQAFRGEGGQARLRPWPVVPGHPRVTAWAGTGSPSYVRSGFLAAATAGPVSGLVTVESARLGGVEPLGGEGDHSLAGEVRYEPYGWTFEGAYRSTRQSLTGTEGEFEQRSGEAGRLAAETYRGATTIRLSVERSQETLAATLPALPFFSQVAKADRARAEVRRGATGQDVWIAGTYGRETRGLEGDLAYPRREVSLWWGALGFDRPIASRSTLTGALGAGAYGGGAVQVAPLARVSFAVSPGTHAWAGVARGLGAEIDPRVADAGGGPLAGDPPVRNSSSWIGGVGLGYRTAAEDSGGTWQGPWARGERNARGAFYVGASDPGFDPPRRLFASQALVDAQTLAPAEETRFVALVVNGSWAPVRGMRLSAGGHALGRRVSAALTPSDPDWRLRLTVEGRERFLQGDLDLRIGVTGEAIGPRASTPAGDLPTATRLGLFGELGIDEFALRAEFRNLAGSNRLLPVPGSDGFTPLRAEESRWLLEARWTFWD